MIFSRAFLIAVLTAGTAGAGDFVINQHTFTVPDGFTVELVSGTNLVQRPVSASFDDQGRLYVTDSSGSNEAPAKQLENPTHRLLRLEDTNGDGVFDRSIVFADKVMFPQGCLWHGGSVYVAAPPSIWKFTDTNGDGVADQREEWFKGGTLTGCANDIHGPYLGPDGYIYWTKGAFAEQTHKLGNGRTLSDKAAHIYRARPDGSDLDVIMSGGMDNPVEIAFTPDGETIFSSTFIDFTQPGFRDGVAHAIYGGVFGKVNDVLDDGRVKRTSPDLFHPFYEAGPAAECGLTRYSGTGLGSEYRDNFFATTFNLHKVTRHVLRPEGATFASTDSDFLTTDDPDFHPTDVLEAPDGSLLVVDTGGWYRLCCPSSQLAKPDVLGAIYRVKKVGAPALPPSELQAAQRRLTLPPRMAEASLTADLKRAVWSQNPSQAPRFLEMLRQRTAQPGSPENAPVVRVAAEGLGRLRIKEAVPLLLSAAGAPSDDFLTHSLIYALIEIAGPTETRNGLQSPVPRTQRAALIALDQMASGGLKFTEVTPFFSASDERLRAAADWILGRHPEWGGEVAGWLRDQLAAPKIEAARRNQLQALFAILTQAPAGQQLLAEVAAGSGFGAENRAAALAAMADAGLKEPPAGWKEAVLVALKRPGSEATSALGAARSLNGDGQVQAALLAIANDPGQSSQLRLDALAALPAGAPLGSAEFEFLRQNLAAARTPVTRSTSASVLARAKLTPDQLASLTGDVPAAGPLELSKLLGAFDGGGDDGLGQKLVSALASAKGAKALAPGQLKPHFAKFPPTTQQAADAFLATLNADAKQQGAHLDSLLTELKQANGDVRRGQTIFNGPKAACSACHRIGYLGGNIGPELTKIGEVRSERDLLESIIYPNQSFVRSYEPTLVVLKNGEQLSGIVRRETPEEILVATGPGPEQHVRRSEVAETLPGAISVMPGGFDQTLSRQELADLLLFVKTVRWR